MLAGADRQEGSAVVRRSQFIALCTALLLLAGGGTAYVVSRPGAAPHHHAPGSAATPRPDVLGMLASTTIPSASGVAHALRKAVRDPAFGNSLVGLVVDADSGRQLFAQGADTAVPPASTAKLLTSLAVLGLLGPTARLPTNVVRAGGTLYLVGGGDVTLTAAPPTGSAADRPPAYPSSATIQQLARRTAAALGTSTTMRLRYDTSAWPAVGRAPGWNAGYFTAGDVSRLSALEVDEGRLRPGVSQRVADPALVAAQDFAVALQAAGVHVTGRPRPGIAPPSTAPVASVRSAPVAALLQRTLTVSDNDLAEALGRTAARRSGQPATFAGEAAAISGQLRRLGIPMPGLRLYDASGLSRLDRVTPRALVAALRLVVRPTARGEFGAVEQGLPVAGFTGTLADRYRGRAAGAAAGVVRAKTGTLAGVSALAGQVVDVSGRLLLFAFVTDHAPSPTAAEGALDRLATRLARCGCR